MNSVKVAVTVANRRGTSVTCTIDVPEGARREEVVAVALDAFDTATAEMLAR